ncbi:hypothetical protein [Candidatus Villigracilis saccharophilus]|uniref:hypothetical protein n=1 Tax=Candidatus Villigracilis saccharophilus TaxID=3140684 RepID=UPI003135123D|nr:hypothetical protein [Anaerolineales bacterium]
MKNSRRPFEASGSLKNLTFAFGAGVDSASEQRKPEATRVHEMPVQCRVRRAGQTFRMAAQSGKQADCAFGAMYRRLWARLGPSQAIVRVVYRMLKYKVEYDPSSVNEYQKQYKEQQIKYMKKKSAKFGPSVNVKSWDETRRPRGEDALFSFNETRF